MSKKEENQNQMIDYLYDEMNDQEKEAFEVMLRKHPELQKELKELRMTRDLMNAHPAAIPSFQGVHSVHTEPITETTSKSEQQQKGRILHLSPFVSNLVAITASILIVILGMTYAGVERDPHCRRYPE